MLFGDVNVVVSVANDAEAFEAVSEAPWPGADVFWRTWLGLTPSEIVPKEVWRRARGREGCIRYDEKFFVPSWPGISHDTLISIYQEERSLLVGKIYVFDTPQIALSSVLRRYVMRHQGGTPPPCSSYTDILCPQVRAQLEDLFSGNFARAFLPTKVQPYVQYEAIPRAVAEAMGGCNSSHGLPPPPFARHLPVDFNGMWFSAGNCTKKVRGTL